MQTYFNYINGQWVPARSGRTDTSCNPANGEAVGSVPQSAAEDVRLAVAAASAAKAAWRKLSGASRGDFLYRTATIMESRLDDIAETMTREMGKTLPEAKGETQRGIAILRYFAGEGMRKTGDVIPSTDPGAMMYSTRVPLGVVGVITPWNFPVAIPLWKMAPALIYGNVVVWKPASLTPVTAVKIAECFHEAGLPAGVVNLISGAGREVGQTLIDHPEVNGITFTGSNGTGKKIAVSAIARGAKYQLEMGGKNPLIVAADADLDLAAEGAVSGGLRSTGQKCTATSRVYVHTDVYEEFKKRLMEKVGRITVGNGMDSRTWMGPCASEDQLHAVLGYIRQGIDEGAALIHGGSRLQGAGFEGGYYVEPAVFDQVSNGMAIAREEIFGPVLALIRISSLEEALRLANDSEFGLSASIYTKDLQTMLTFVNEMEAGLVRVNSETAGVELQAPFGGMKQSSSHSREQGQAAVEFFTSVKTVFIKA